MLTACRTSTPATSRTPGSWPARCTRRDRLWQMELYRRAASGRLAEVLGEPALPIDRRMLTLRIRAAAAAEWARLRAPARAALQRYTEGVNAAMATLPGRRRPLEFQMLGIHAGAVDARGLAGDRPAAGLSAGREPRRRTGAPRPDPGGRARSRPTGWRDAIPTRDRPCWATLPPSSRAGAGRDPPSARTGAGRRPAAPAVGPAASRADDARRACLARSDRAAGQQQRVGRVRPAHRHRPANPRQRSASAHRAALGLVRAAPGGGRARRAGRVDSRNAVCRHRPQRPDRLGLHQHRRRRAGLRASSASTRPAGACRRAAAGSRCRSRTRRFRCAAGPSRRRSKSGVRRRASSTPTSASSGSRRRRGCRRMRLARVSSARSCSSGRASTAAASPMRSRRSTVPATGRSSRRPSTGSRRCRRTRVYADVDGNIGYLMTGPGAGARARRRHPPGARADVEWGGTSAGRPCRARSIPRAGTSSPSNNPVARGDVPFITRDWAAPFRAARVTGVLAEATALDVAGATALQLDRQSAAAAEVLAGIDGALAAAARPGRGRRWSPSSSG